MLLQFVEIVIDNVEHRIFLSPNPFSFFDFISPFEVFVPHNVTRGWLKIACAPALILIVFRRRVIP